MTDLDYPDNRADLLDRVQSYAVSVGRPPEVLHMPLAMEKDCLRWRTDPTAPADRPETVCGLRVVYDADRFALE